MILRWSDECSYSYEFPAEKDFERSLANALIEFRRKKPRGKAHLHIKVHDRLGGWHLPLFGWTIDGKPVNLTFVLDTPEDVERAKKEFARFRGGYTLVMHDPDGEPDPPGSRPRAGSGYYELRIGPGAWHAKEVKKACNAAMDARKQFLNLLGKTMESLETEQKGK